MVLDLAAEPIIFALPSQFVGELDCFFDVMNTINRHDAQIPLLMPWIGLAGAGPPFRNPRITEVAPSWRFLQGGPACVDHLTLLSGRFASG